nr:unnamed protein product [Callosobruchus analis]
MDCSFACMLCSFTIYVDSQLNKIVKKDLIYYIINKKLPANIVSALSEEVVKFLEKGQQDDEVFHDSIATEQEVCRNVSCLNRCGDSTTRCEISMENILIRELERSNNSLNTIVSLLQAQNSKVMRDQNNTPQTRSRQNNPIDSLPLSTETRGRSPTSVARSSASTTATVQSPTTNVIVDPWQELYVGASQS